MKDEVPAANGNIRHKLIDIIVIAFTAVMCGYEDYGAMEEFGRLKPDFFKGFLELPDGTPDESAFRRVPQCLNPRELREGLDGRLTDIKLGKDREGAAARPVNIDGKTIRGGGGGFPLTCKDGSHPWIAEQVKYSNPQTYGKTEWSGRNHSVHRYKRVNGIENRADGEVMKVNHLYFEIYNREKKTVTYKNSRITNLEIKESNVESMTACARAGREIENGNNNVLKNHGYNLAHNVETKFPRVMGRNMRGKYFVISIF
ncbi:MAG: transposase family protein [Spirochaetaceae bacterium]|nr:transposase family protein [Spirochaetaceae bacterium]